MKSKSITGKNKLAVCLMLSMNPKKLGLINMINNTKTSIWSDGDAQAIWDDLYRRFVPKTALSRAQIRVELDNLKSERGKDPRVLFDKIEIIQAKMTERGFYSSEEEYIAAIIKALPSEYDHSLVNANST